LNFEIVKADDKAVLRHVVLECLVNRHPAALPVAGIVRRVKTEVDFGFDQDEVVSALELLEGKGLVKWQFDELGGGKWWSATAEGVLAVERGSV
jgi:hypothetical protein